MVGYLKVKATSLMLETVQKTSRELLLAQILFYFEYYLENIRLDNPHWLFICAHKNQNILFHLGNDIVEGKFIDLDENGLALIEHNGGIQSYSGSRILL